MPPSAPEAIVFLWGRPGARGPACLPASTIKCLQSSSVDMRVQLIPGRCHEYRERERRGCVKGQGVMAV